MDSRHPTSPLPRSSSVYAPRRSNLPTQVNTPERMIHAWLQPPRQALPALLEAIAWMLTAAILRWSANWVLAAMPALWVPVALLLLLPAILAVSLSFWAANLSPVLGYRLILIAIGLVLGGKL